MPYPFASLTFPRAFIKLPSGPIANLKAKRAFRGPYFLDPGTTPSPEVSFYLESDFQPFTRWTWCDEVEGVCIDHDGWFCDDFQDQTIRGLVVRLSHGRGFLAGWSMGEGMASVLDRATVWENEQEAAYDANRMAESAAADQQDYGRKENARLEAEEAQETAEAVCVAGDGI